jgi:hypothetical protein
MLGKSDFVRQQVNKVFHGIFSNAKRAMIGEFDRNPITLELKAGPTASNISETMNGYGNLFSFIGFEAGTEPTAPLRELLSEKTDYRQTVYRNRSWYFRVDTPSRQEIAEATPMPWEVGRSWVQGIEQGMSNLSFYIFTHWEGPTSRSKEGLQLDTKSNAGGWEYSDEVFSPRPYMKEILAKFRERINNNQKVS